jgi:DNA-binding NtrC family response regulator
MARSRRLRVLVADDEPAIREVLRLRLAEWGCAVKLAAGGREARKKYRAFQPDLVISDVVMPGMTGFDLLRSLQKRDPRRLVILMTGYGSVDMAVEALQNGAKDFMTKPLDYSKLKTTIETAQTELKTRSRSRRTASDQRQEDGHFGDFVGSDRSMRDVYRLIEDVAKTDTPVLITGESGTGKELTARSIHIQSQRCNGPFVAVNTAAIPKELMESEILGHEKGAFTGAWGVRQGCFEQADRGTLFLDEIAEMTPSLQPKLLRVLEGSSLRRVGGREELQFDVRSVVATNRDPRDAVREGRLREDLFYRIDVFRIHLPALRDRSGDISLLAQHFLDIFGCQQGNRILGLDEKTVSLLNAYAWPGNVRELRNVIQRAVVLAKGEWIKPADLPQHIRNGGSGLSGTMVIDTGTTLQEITKQVILKTLEQCGQNKTETARQLGIDVKTVRNRLKSYGIS